MGNERISFPDFYYEADLGQLYAGEKRRKKTGLFFYDQIKENQEPETADPVEPILAQGNEKSMLRQLRTCMEALGREGIGDALMQTFEALRQYFDADCVVLAYAKEGGIRYVHQKYRFERVDESMEETGKNAEPKAETAQPVMQKAKASKMP